MRGLLILFSIVAFAHCSCPSGFELVRDGECRGKYATLTGIPFDETTDVAIAKCAEINAQPVIIHNEEHQSYWLAQRTETLTMGLVCNSNSMRWQWKDGSAIYFKPASYNTDLDKDCRTGCSWYLSQSGSWDYGCEQTVNTIDIFCTTQLQQPAPSSDGCESFADDDEDGVCYQIGTTAESRHEAQIICKSFGADLASIHNQKENSFVRRLAVSKGELCGLFLGGTLAGKGNEFAWIDGSDWDYNNFYPGFPMTGLGNCIAMDTQGATGEWVNADCESPMSVACMRKQNYSPPACSAGPWTEGQIIYSPGFPIDSSAPCDFIFSVEAGKKVEVEILFLEANTCCDHLKIYDNYIAGNLIANLSGEIRNQVYTSTSNCMRVSWQPSGGANVRGLMMTYRVADSSPATTTLPITIVPSTANIPSTTTKSTCNPDAVTYNIVMFIENTSFNFNTPETAYFITQRLADVYQLGVNVSRSNTKFMMTGVNQEFFYAGIQQSVQDIDKARNDIERALYASNARVFDLGLALRTFNKSYKTQFVASKPIAVVFTALESNDNAKPALQDLKDSGYTFIGIAYNDASQNYLRTLTDHVHRCAGTSASDIYDAAQFIVDVACDVKPQ